MVNLNETAGSARLRAKLGGNLVDHHHLGVSQSERVVWLMEELGPSIRIMWHKRGADGLAPASYLALHPAATAPVVQDGHRTLCESAAILEYVCHKYAGGRLTVSSRPAEFLRLRVLDALQQQHPRALLHQVGARRPDRRAHRRVRS